MGMVVHYRSILLNIICFLFCWQLAFNNAIGYRLSPFVYFPVIYLLLIIYYIQYYKRIIKLPISHLAFFLGLAVVLVSSLRNPRATDDAIYYCFQVILVFYACFFLFLFLDGDYDKIVKIYLVFIFIQIMLVYIEWLFPSFFFEYLEFSPQDLKGNKIVAYNNGANIGVNTESGRTALNGCIGICCTSLFLYKKNSEGLRVIFVQLFFLFGVFLTQRRLSSAIAIVLL